MKRSIALLMLGLMGWSGTFSIAQNPYKPVKGEPAATFEGKKLVWHDEFNGRKGAMPDKDKWSFEEGFVRNEELQWYCSQNAHTDGKGNMVIEGKVEEVKNHRYQPGSSEWRLNRESAHFTSSCIHTNGKYEFKYGTMVVRAKIPTAMGAWPAIWTLGTKYEWPLNGEVDQLEYYIKYGKPSILANTAWGGKKRYDPIWNSTVIPFINFTDKDPNWADKYHVWRMDWDEKSIKLYLDGELLNYTDLSKTVNMRSNGLEGEGENAFHHSQYILLNLAIGGNGGTPDKSKFPLKYYIDYVRIYQ